MKVLVTGCDGYLGSLLTTRLLREGHDVTGIDVGFFRAAWLYNGQAEAPRTISKDVRHITRSDLEGFDVVVHMGELSNDPLGQLDPGLTAKVNHGGSLRLAELAKDAGVSRFIHMSSCSVYGIVDGIVDETSPIDPQTAYARCKAMVERDVHSLADDDFSPTFLRNATAFGASPRMRFDIVLNNLAGVAWTTNEIAMTSDGSPWRPLVHGLDIAKAILCVLDAPREAIHDEVFNVGDNTQNYRVREIAEAVAAVFTDCAISFGPADADNRSYRVNFDKINTSLPGFRCEWSAERGAQQLYDVLSSTQLTQDEFAGRNYIRLRQLEHLIATGQVDHELFWTTT